MTLYVTLFVIFAGFVFTMTLAHPFPAKSVTLILMVVADVVTNLSADCTKINQMQKMTAGEATGGLKFILLEVTLQQAFQTTAMTSLVASHLVDGASPAGMRKCPFGPFSA